MDPRDWATLESRVSARPSDPHGLEEPASAATFLRAGLGTDRIPPRPGSGRGGTRWRPTVMAQVTAPQPAEFARNPAGKGGRGRAGTAVIGYRAPNFSVVRETLWSLDILAGPAFVRLGIFRSCTTYGIPDAPRFPHQRRSRRLRDRRVPLSTVAAGRWRMPVPAGYSASPVPLTRRALRYLKRRAAAGTCTSSVGARHGQPACRWPVTPFRHSVNTREGSEAAAAREGLPLWTGA